MGEMGIVMLSLADGAGRASGILEGHPPAAAAALLAALVLLSAAVYMLAQAPDQEAFLRR